VSPQALSDVTTIQSIVDMLSTAITMFTSINFVRV